MNATIDFPRLFLEMFVWEKLNTKEEIDSVVKKLKEMFAVTAKA